ncbi:hypothetical protein ARMGADRAFT_1030227 [Armillaria gallica]|uniref:Uncharacterized protein n=1 Tax=Armillaria gallica TaxID=47427 RepID=A0A2H3DS09_ARMGA|nr:hypothetical protein ARMGADRAFT_1030227 [Armillaria gallica]
MFPRGGWAQVSNMIGYEKNLVAYDARFSFNTPPDSHVQSPTRQGHDDGHCVKTSAGRREADRSQIVAVHGARARLWEVNFIQPRQHPHRLLVSIAVSKQANVRRSYYEEDMYVYAVWYNDGETAEVSG